MNRVVIPSVLAAIVLVAGLIVANPVYMAGTTHHLGAGPQVMMKLSSDPAGPTTASGGDGQFSTVVIRALTGAGNPGVFNLKECYLRGTTNGGVGDDIQVTAILIDGNALFTGTNAAFTPFGPTTDASGGVVTNMVEILSGLGFHTGLGATDTITMTVTLDAGELINEIFCIAFVPVGTDLAVTATNPAGGP